MKTLDEYMSLPYRMEFVEDKEEGGYTVYFPELPGCLTCGEDIQTAYNNAVDAKREWLKASMEEGIAIPEPESGYDFYDENSYSGQFKLRMPKSLHRALAEHSKREGVSMNQYCVYLLSRNDTLFENPINKNISV